MKRPKIITWFCIIGYLTVIITFPQVFSPSIKKLGVLMPAVYGVLVASHFIACVGIWYFKQWGVQLYFISVFGRVLFFVFIRQYTPGFFINLAISLIFMAVLLRFFNRMSQDL